MMQSVQSLACETISTTSSPTPTGAHQNLQTLRLPGAHVLVTRMQLQFQRRYNARRRHLGPAKYVRNRPKLEHPTELSFHIPNTCTPGAKCRGYVLRPHAQAGEARALHFHLGRGSKYCDDEQERRVVAVQLTQGKGP